ncbi:hypothetical protein ABID95_004395 [Streptomyces atratus]
MLGQFAFETRAEVVLVADESLSGALSQKLAFGCQEVKEGLAFVGLGPVQGEGDGQAPSMACIVARVTSSASLRRGVMPTGGRHGASPGCSFRMSSVVA